MHVLRRLNTAMEHLADRLQGQDIERRTTAGGERRGGSDYAALMRARQSQGSSTIGFGR